MESNTCVYFTRPEFVREEKSNVSFGSDRKGSGGSRILLRGLTKFTEAGDFREVQGHAPPENLVSFTPDKIYPDLSKEFYESFGKMR